jgi:hypothetical protein
MGKNSGTERISFAYISPQDIVSKDNAMINDHKNIN